MSTKLLIASILMVSPIAMAKTVAERVAENQRIMQEQEAEANAFAASNKIHLDRMLSCQSNLILEVDDAKAARLQSFAQKQSLRSVRISTGVLRDQRIPLDTKYLRQTGENSYSVRLLDEKGQELTLVDSAKLEKALNAKALSTDIFLADAALEGRQAIAEVRFDMINKHNFSGRIDALDSMSDDSTGQEVLIQVPVSLMEIKKLSQQNMQAAMTLEGDMAAIVGVSAVDSIPDETILRAHEQLLMKLKACK